MSALRGLGVYAAFCSGFAAAVGEAWAAFGTGALAALYIALAACSAKQEPPPCDPASYAVLAASCGDDELECNRQIDERQAYCAERIRTGEK